MKTATRRTALCAVVLEVLAAGAPFLCLIPLFAPAEAGDTADTSEPAPAAACYHAISSGHTQASQRVWQESLPYLQGVDSPWDKYAQDYEVTVQYTSQQVSDCLYSALGIHVSGDPSTWVGDTVWDDAGYVDNITLCGQTVSPAPTCAAP